jgi:hypothetical protein
MYRNGYDLRGGGKRPRWVCRVTRKKSQREYKERQIAKGKCAKCLGREAAPGYTTCEVCKAYQADYYFLRPGGFRGS